MSIILVLFTVSCGKTTEIHLFAMDTLLDIKLNGNIPDTLEADSSNLVTTLEKQLSATIPDSDVYNFNVSDSGCTVSDETNTILELSLEVANMVGGFDVTIYPLVELWNISHAGDDWTPPAAGEINDALVHVGADKLSLNISDSQLTKSDPLTKIDLGGVGKGWATGALATMIANECPDAWGTLSFGGNVAVIGEKPDGDFNIALRDPFGSGLAGELHIESGIVAVSGGYERYVDYDGRRYHHIIDPSTGYPSESDLASAAVYVSSASPEAGAYADALSTALFVLGSERAVELIESELLTELCGCDVGLVLIKSDGSISTHGALEGCFTEY